MELIDIAREFLMAVKGELDPWTTRKGEINVESEYAVTLLTPFHAHYAKYGRPPGKQPPVDDMLEWVKREGIIFEGNTELGTAWAIAKSIAKKGTANYDPNAPYIMEEAIDKHIDEYLKKASNYYSVIVRDQMRRMEILPGGIKTYKI